jgi:hypothetical protein
VEDELGDEDGPQQFMMQHEDHALLDLLQRMTPRGNIARGLMDAGQQYDRNSRQYCSHAKRGRGADPSDQHAAERGAAGKGNGARELDAGVCGGEQLRADQRRHQRRRGNAVDHGATDRDEAEQGQQRQGEPVKRDQREDLGQRQGAHRFGARHQAPTGHAIGEQARGDRDQHEGQGQRGLQQAGLAFADAEQEHGDDWGCCECDLLRRLRRQVRPGEPVEGGGQFGSVGGHGEFHGKRQSTEISASRTAKPTRFTHPIPENTASLRKLQMHLRMSCNKARDRSF